MIRRFARLPLALVTILAVGMATGWAVEINARNAVLATITAAEAKEYVQALADDTFEGRESGSRGGRAAGIYIVERLKKHGLHGGGPNGSFYQSFGNYHNILALAEGRDPVLRDQTVIVSAHYDHVGYGNARNSFGPTGFIHNGADDNASGVAGLLEVAEAVSQLPEQPKRSILFAFWDGEEKGLIGSQHWVDNPTVPLKQVPIMVNADMIGRLRNSRVTVFGTRTSKGLRRLISRQNDVSQLFIDFTWEMKADSDHHTFYTRGIPIVMMHTGLHGDYHRPSDDADKINAEGLRQVAQLMCSVAIELAETTDLAGFRAQSRHETRSDQAESERSLPAPAGRLGVRWDEERAKSGQLAITAVTRGSAADKAGIRAGDRLVEFDGREINTVAEFRQDVLAADGAVPAMVERPGEETPRTVILELPGKPVRLGISWRSDDAERGCVILNRVIAESPAQQAGLRVNDRVYRAAGQEFSDSESFRRLVTDAASPLTLEVETAGQVRTVEIPLADVPAASTSNAAAPAAD